MSQEPFGRRGVGIGFCNGVLIGMCLGITLTVVLEAVL